MRLNNARTTRTRVVAALLIMSISALARAEIQIEPDLASSFDSAVASQLLRDNLSRASSRLAALTVRVTIGPAALENAIATADGRPIIATFLTSTEFEEASGGGRELGRVTAIFSNPDPRDQVALAKLLLGRPALCVLDSPATHHLLERLADPSVQAITATQNVDLLLRGADPCDAIVALPDSGILNRSNISHVVRTLYQRRKVLIGYSVTLTRIGSLASVYVPPEAIARSVVDVLESYADTGLLPPPIFVSDVDLAVNERLARSLNISIPARDQLIDGIRARRQ